AAPRRRPEHAHLSEAGLHAGHVHDPQLPGRRHRRSRRRADGAASPSSATTASSRTRRAFRAPRKARTSPGSRIRRATSCPCCRTGERSRIDGVKGLHERCEQDVVLVAEGYLFELERRGYLKSGTYVPEA